jgi:hypothetical protein
MNQMRQDDVQDDEDGPTDEEDQARQINPQRIRTLHVSSLPMENAETAPSNIGKSPHAVKHPSLY